MGKVISAMFKKHFVSIFFHKNKLYVWQLSKDKKKVKKYLTVSIPSEIISDDKVKNIILLSKILKELWAKMDIKDKFVSVCISEYKAFIKLIKVPKIPIAEMHEAVLLQSQEFLPSEHDATVIDWKIVNEESNQYEVLFVAIEKSLLFGYIKAIEKAGLFPLLVEIPSVSLSRYAIDNESTIIVYGLDQNAVVVFTKNSKVIASSVLSSQDLQEIFITVKRILNHFKEEKIDSIKIGGDFDGKSQAVLNYLSKICTNISPIDVSLNGISSNEIQNYLIPLSMQKTELLEPKDPYSINLLPDKLVIKYENKRLRLRLWSLLLSITLFVWVCLFTALGVYVYFGQISSHFRRLADVNGATKNKEFAVITSQEANSVTTKVLSIKKATTSSVELLSIVEQARPKGVSIKEYKLNFDKGQFELKGVALDRLSLIEFRQNLEKNEKVKSVQIPLSSFEVDKNLEFDISFNYIVNSVSSIDKNDKKR